MATFPQTGATQLVVGQAVPETSVNEIGYYLDANATRSIIEDRDLTAPPGSCSDGARYLVAASPTGAWSGKAGKLAIAVGTNAASGWLFQTIAVEGYKLYVRDEDKEIYYTGAAWADTTLVAITEAANSDVWAGSATTKYLSPSKLYTASAPVALTSSTTITPDGNNGFNFSLTLAHNTTLANPSNFKTGQSGVIVITQDGTGSRTMAYGSQWKFPGGAPVLSTAAAAVDVISYFVSATGSQIIANLSKAYS